MPHPVPGPTFGLSRWSAPDENDWAAYLAHVMPHAAAPLAPDVAAAILRNEAVLLGRPARASTGR
jgi:hypothetical protein